MSAAFSGVKDGTSDYQKRHCLNNPRFSQVIWYLILWTHCFITLCNFYEYVIFLCSVIKLFILVLFNDLYFNRVRRAGRIIVSSYNGKNLSERFLQRCCWRFRSSEMWHHVACVVVDISKERSAYVCEGQAVQEAVLPNV